MSSSKFYTLLSVNGHLKINPSVPTACIYIVYDSTRKKYIVRGICYPSSRYKTVHVLDSSSPPPPIIPDDEIETECLHIDGVLDDDAPALVVLPEHVEDETESNSLGAEVIQDDNYASVSACDTPIQEIDISSDEEKVVNIDTPEEHAPEPVVSESKKKKTSELHPFSFLCADSSFLYNFVELLVNEYSRGAEPSYVSKIQYKIYQLPKTGSDLNEITYQELYELTATDKYIVTKSNLLYLSAEEFFLYSDLLTELIDA